MLNLYIPASNRHSKIIFILNFLKIIQSTFALNLFDFSLLSLMTCLRGDFIYVCQILVDKYNSSTPTGKQLTKVYILPHNKFVYFGYVDHATATFFNISTK